MQDMDFPMMGDLTQPAKGSVHACDPIMLH
jgi:hypothetical protein